MPVKIYSATNIGLDAKIIEIETDVSFGLRCFNIVGLGDKAIQESKERIGAALKSSGFTSPHSKPERVLVNLAPANLKKEGSLYDLPIAIGYLAASKQIIFLTQNKLFIGELGLDGKLKPAKGALSFALKAKQQNFSEIILPEQNASEAAVVKDLKVIGAKNLSQVIGYLKGEIEIAPFKIEKQDFFKQVQYPVNISWIKGQQYAKRALEISAAGAHNLMMMGPPGTGKTLLAKAICSILPSLSFEENLEVTKIYSVAGLLPKNTPLINIRPFRSPHHSSSEVSLLGGGNPIRPGEITLAHRGILFLDEFPEFHRDVLQSLRQCLESGEITILRAKHCLTFPAKFTMVAASNPCPCGYYRDPEKRCVCTSSQIQKYRRKLTGPLMDRIDLFIEVPQVKYEKLIKENEDTTITIRQKIQQARKIQTQRFSSFALNGALEDKSTSQNYGKFKSIMVNAEMNIPQIKKYCEVPLQSQGILKQYVNSSKLSARGYHRVLKVSRTIADLDNSEKILNHHLTEALMYRTRSNE
ncbi:MAG: YifB family Mg chelatase-like AAA ATPase [Candidatus Pacebacteria bacterium]|nr:YifB family Mg chelatase-like AAA ATPase [Candidatus Paceibacterota bacterium]